MPTEGRFGRCCCDVLEPLRSNATVRAMVPYHGFRLIEPWMIGQWDYNAATGIGTGPNGATGANVATAINAIAGLAYQFDVWRAAGDPWNMANGDLPQHYLQCNTQQSSTTTFPEYVDGGGVTRPAGSTVVTNSVTGKIDSFANVVYYWHASGTVAVVNDPTTYSESGSYHWELGEDGVVTEALTGSYGNVAHTAADDTQREPVTSMTVSSTGFIEHQTSHTPYWPEKVTVYDGTMTLSQPITWEEVWTETERLLGTVNLSTVAAGDWLIKWVWAQGTPKAVVLGLNPEIAPTGAERLWRVMGAHQAVMLTKMRHLTGTVYDDLERGEQLVWTTRTTPPWGTNNGAPPTFSGVSEVIPDYVGPGVVILMLPELVSLDIPPSYLGYTLGKADIAP